MIQPTKQIAYVNLTLDHSFKGGVFGGTQLVAILNEDNHDEGILHLLQQSFLGDQVGLVFKPGGFLRFSIEEQIRKLRPTGIINRIFDNWIKKRFIDPIVKKTGPQVFSLEHLMIGFQVLLLFLMIAFLVFLIECRQTLLIHIQNCFKR